MIGRGIKISRAAIAADIARQERGEGRGRVSLDETGLGEGRRQQAQPGHSLLRAPTQATEKSQSTAPPVTVTSTLEVFAKSPCNKHGYIAENMF